MSGFDSEVGGKVMRFGTVDLRAFVGTYYFGVDNGPDTWGGRARVEARISDTIALGLSVQRDKLFDTTVNLHVTLSWPTLTGRRRDDRGDGSPTPGDRLGESIERIQQVVVSRRIEQVVVARQAALDPFTGLPLVFLHVAPGGNSDGSFENPYATLDKAFHDPRFAAGNVIVYDRTQGTYTGNVTLAPGTAPPVGRPAPDPRYAQRRQDRPAVQRRGPDPLGPAADPRDRDHVERHDPLRLPRHRTRSAGNGPASADLVTQAPGSQVRDVRIDNNVLVGGNVGVNLFNAAGNVDVVNNRFQNQAITGINVQAQHDDTASIRITDNVVGGSGLNGIYMTVNDVMGMNAKVDASIQHNQISNSATPASPSRPAASSRLDASIEGNSVANATGSGIEVLDLPRQRHDARRHHRQPRLAQRAFSAGGHRPRGQLAGGVPDLDGPRPRQPTHRQLHLRLQRLRRSGQLPVPRPARQQRVECEHDERLRPRPLPGLFGVVDVPNLGKNNTGKVDVTGAPLANILTLP